MLILKILSFIIVYVIKQRLFKQKVSIQRLIYALILAFIFYPTMQKTLTKVEYIRDLETYVEWIIMLILFV